MCNETLAHGPASVCSDVRPECHAPSGYSVRDYSGANGARDRQRDMILAFWEAQGMARRQCVACGSADVTDAGMCRVCRTFTARWYVRDAAQGGADWLPLAGQGDAGRADVAEFSHVRSAANGGAWCACGLVAESGAVNAARGDRDMTDAEVPAAWRATLAAWPAYWRANVARKASLARLAK